MPYAMVGTLTANGMVGSRAAPSDINDVAFASRLFPRDKRLPIFRSATPPTALALTDGGDHLHYLHAVFPTVTLDFVLSSSSHGLVTEFDANGTGSGTIDLQSAGTNTRWRLRLQRFRSFLCQQPRPVLPRSATLLLAAQRLPVP